MDLQWRGNCNQREVGPAAQTGMRKRAYARGRGLREPGGVEGRSPPPWACMHACAYAWPPCWAPAQVGVHHHAVRAGVLGTSSRPPHPRAPPPTHPTPSHGPAVAPPLQAYPTWFEEVASCVSAHPLRHINGSAWAGSVVHVGTAWMGVGPRCRSHRGVCHDPQARGEQPVLHDAGATWGERRLAAGPCRCAGQHSLLRRGTLQPSCAASLPLSHPAGKLPPTLELLAAWRETLGQCMSLPPASAAAPLDPARILLVDRCGPRVSRERVVGGGQARRQRAPRAAVTVEQVPRLACLPSSDPRRAPTRDLQALVRQPPPGQREQPAARAAPALLAAPGGGGAGLHGGGCCPGGLKWGV